jgi:hypothetical protein
VAFGALMIGALAVGLATASLLSRLLFAATAQSFDTMIYARGLWGLGHADPANPVLGVPTLAVHAHGLLLLLAPLARWVDATALLVGAQAAAAAATVAIAAHWASRPFAGSGARALIVLGATVLLVPASPFFANPLLFDARPDLAGVPLALAAMLRARDAGRFDRTATALAWSAVLMREEFALLTIVPAIAIAPLPRETRGRRLRVALPMLAYWAIYWFVLRGWLGGAAETVQIASYSRLWLGGASTPAEYLGLLGAKVEILAAAVATGGGLALFGGRWLAAAAPAVAFVLVTSRLQSLQLNFHYPLFAAPALIVAAIVATERARRWVVDANASAQKVRMTVAALAPLVVGASIALSSSAWPGGGRWRPAYFAANSTTLARHATLETLDRDSGLIVPYEIGAAVADRQHAWTTLRLARTLRAGDPIPQEFSIVVLAPAEVAELGPRVAEQFGDFGQVIASAGLTVYRRRSPSVPSTI